MKTIALINSDLVAVVDNEDFDWLNEFPWYAHPVGYAQTTADTYPVSSAHPFGIRKSTCTLMHRLVLNAPKGKHVDHIDRDKLHNRKSNLRLATRSENRTNTGILSTNKIGLKGVSLVSGCTDLYRAQFKSTHLGCFHDPEDAARAYDAAVDKYAGVFGVTNRSLGLLA